MGHSENFAAIVKFRYDSVAKFLLCLIAKFFDFFDFFKIKIK